VAFTTFTGLGFPFALLGSVLLAYPPAAPFAWPVLVVYTQVFVLIEYWQHFK
jgi:hypothetical protein